MFDFAVEEYETMTEYQKISSKEEPKSNLMQLNKILKLEV